VSVSPSEIMREVWSYGNPRFPARPVRDTSWGSAPRRHCAAAVGLGVDMFDCVLPTTQRWRATAAFSPAGAEILIKNVAYAEDARSTSIRTAHALHCRRYTPGLSQTSFLAGEHLSRYLIPVHNLSLLS